MQGSERKMGIERSDKLYSKEMEHISLADEAKKETVNECLDDLRKKLYEIKQTDWKYAKTRESYPACFRS